MGEAVDPLSLLKALSHLLNRKGGVIGVEEMEKIVTLMMDANQLVSRCVYLNILRVTETNELLEKFIVQGGWAIMNKWLIEAKTSENMALILEVMKLLQRLPLRIDHLKQNNTPKLVKGFVKSASCQKVKSTASTLMTNWLAIIRDSSASPSASDVSTKKKKPKTKPKFEKPTKNDGKKSSVDSKPPPASRAPSFAKFRKTGLETDQEPRKKIAKNDKKSAGVKRSSIEEATTVPDKKVKVEPKPAKKITISPGFMDALNSVPTVVKRPVKRKPLKPKTVPITSTSAEKLSPAHDSAVSGEAGDFGDFSETHVKSPSPTPSPTEVSKPKLDKYGKPMKTVRWVEESRLESIRYFEMEEGERVNVTTQSFKDALHRERLLEREKMGGFHHKEESDWKKPKLIDLPPSLVEIGCNSIEKEIQSEREKTVLQEIFLTLDMVPDSPAEPDPEPYDMVPPKIIPIEDPNDPGPPVSATPSPTDENEDSMNGINDTAETNGRRDSTDLKDKLREILQTATANVDSKVNENNKQPEFENPPNMLPGTQFPPQGAPNEGDPNMYAGGHPPMMSNGYFPNDPNMMMGPPPPNMQVPNMMQSPMVPVNQYGMEWGPPNNMRHNRPPMDMRHTGPIPPHMRPAQHPRFNQFHGDMNNSWRPREPWMGPRSLRPDFRGRWNNGRARFRR